jgi:hypothetical protein
VGHFLPRCVACWQRGAPPVGRHTTKPHERDKKEDTLCFLLSVSLLSYYRKAVLSIEMFLYRSPTSNKERRSYPQTGMQRFYAANHNCNPVA